MSEEHWRQAISVAANLVVALCSFRLGRNYGAHAMHRHMMASLDQIIRKRRLAELRGDENPT